MTASSAHTHTHKKPKLARPDHFYTHDGIVPVLKDEHPTPSEDPNATRGTPVFRPTMAEFGDFERYMMSVEAWGMCSGIVKVIPPSEWTTGLPSVVPQLGAVRVSKPIEQDVLGSAGLYRVQNIEKNRQMSVREWHELCQRHEHRAPSLQDADRPTRVVVAAAKTPRRSRNSKAKEVTPAASESAMELDPDPADDDNDAAPALDPEADTDAPTTPARKGRRTQRERLDAKASLDAQFLSEFAPHTAWLPPGTAAHDYTPDACRTLERMFWRSLGISRPAWYGADSAGSLFTSSTSSWNVARLPSALDRLLPTRYASLPGVNTPYLYFGMWRATFAWHVEDMDLFSINYIHFGAPKHWYAVPQRRAASFEGIMKAHFPGDTRACPQFLRHKAFLVSPSKLADAGVRPNVLVHHAGEFVITYPRGYHAGFNLGFNCAESVNFALDSWLDLGRRAAYCTCVSDSVHIDVDELLAERA
ncbi:JmjC domain, hydroxylase-domain-containing protein, partial [Auriculariales sp. MPI-PUGE-AT-0066]